MTHRSPKELMHRKRNKGKDTELNIPTTMALIIDLKRIQHFPPDTKQLLSSHFNFHFLNITVDGSPTFRVKRNWGVNNSLKYKSLTFLHNVPTIVYQLI